LVKKVAREKLVKLKKGMNPTYILQQLFWAYISRFHFSVKKYYILLPEKIGALDFKNK